MTFSMWFRREVSSTLVPTSVRTGVVARPPPIHQGWSGANPGRKGMRGPHPPKSNFPFSSFNRTFFAFLTFLLVQCTSFFSSPIHIWALFAHLCNHSPCKNQFSLPITLHGDLASCEGLYRSIGVGVVAVCGSLCVHCKASEHCCSNAVCKWVCKWMGCVHSQTPMPSHAACNIHEYI